MYLALFVLLVILLFVSLYFNVKQRERLLKITGRNMGYPIPTIPLEAFDPAFAADELGPTRAAEVVFIGCGGGVPGGTTDAEAWVLSVLAKHAVCAFEFGTCTGKTAYLWARNAPSEAQVVTLTLLPEQVNSSSYASGDTRVATRAAEQESRFTRYLYTGAEVEAKIVQLYGDSKAFDETPFSGRCDLIFIDGSHAYSYVESDTRKALRMIRPGGVILWHDYRRSFGSAKGVFVFLNTLHRELPLRHLKGTNMVAYRSPVETETTGESKAEN